MSSIITEYNDFKRDITDVVNKHLNKLPAVFISDFLDKLNKEIRVVADNQLKACVEKESEKDDSE